MLNSIYTLLWGPYSIIFIFAIGILLSIRLNFVQITHFLSAMKYVSKQIIAKPDKDREGLSPFQAVATALAGTIGVGSLAGVSTAIAIGGPGAVFWMWVCAFFGMAIKFSEIFLSCLYREKHVNGVFVSGPMYYIKNGLKSKWLGRIYSFFCLLSCFGMGNAVQSNAVAVSLSESLNIKPIISGIILSVIVAMIIFGGLKQIGRFNEKLVPFMGVFYIVCCFIVLIVFRRNIPRAVLSIFHNAFGPRQLAGGAAGFTLSKTVSAGISKGIFMNEAGLGTGSIAHGASTENDPTKEGYFGIFEVFLTTFVMGTFSALVILTSGVWENENAVGIALTIRSFDSAIPYLGKICITVSTIFFSLSTILGWAYYGEVCLEFLSKKISPFLFRGIYISIVFCSSFFNIDTIWMISEIFNGLMVFPNLIAILLLSGVFSKNLKKEKSVSV